MDYSYLVKYNERSIAVYGITSKAHLELRLRSMFKIEKYQRLYLQVFNKDWDEFIEFGEQLPDDKSKIKLVVEEKHCERLLIN